MRKAAVVLFLATAVQAATFNAVVVGPDPERPRAILVDDQDGALPPLQGHVKIVSGDHTVAEAMVYRIQGKQVTLYLTTGSRDALATGLPVTLVEAAAPVAAAPRTALAARPATPEYQTYKDLAVKALVVVDRLKAILPNVSLDVDKDQVRNDLVAKQTESAAVCDQLIDTLTSLQAQAPGKDLYSPTLEQAISLDATTIKATWTDYFTQSQSALDHLKAAASLPKDAAQNERTAAAMCHTTMDNDLDTLRSTFEKLKNDESYLQEALDKNN